jgi:hypothetical protein
MRGQGVKCLIPGHLYQIDHLDGQEKQSIQFVDRNHGRATEGTFNQELLRVLIDRIQFLESEKPWPLNEDILNHLRMALALHEARALCRKVEKGTLIPERLAAGTDGHFIYKAKACPHSA